MRVDVGYSYANAFASKPTESSAGADFSKVMQEAKSTSKSEQVANVDHASKPASSAPNFRSMTASDMLEWTNGEISAGRMTIDESSGFIGMVIMVDPSLESESYEAAFNNQKHDFISVAQGQLEYAEQTSNHSVAEWFQTALDIMNRSQPQQRISETV